MLNMPGMPAYLTAKAGIIGMTKGLAGKLGVDNIRVNMLTPPQRARKDVRVLQRIC